MIWHTVASLQREFCDLTLSEVLLGSPCPYEQNTFPEILNVLDKYRYLAVYDIV